MIELATTGGVLGRIDWPGRTSIIHVDDVAAAMIALSGQPEAAGEIYCVASDESHTVGEISRIVRRAVGGELRPLRIPSALLWTVRRAVWSPHIAAAMPSFARLAFWRLSLIVSDGFWFDTIKFRRVYPDPIRPLEQGLDDILPNRSDKGPAA